MLRHVCRALSGLAMLLWLSSTALAGGPVSWLGGSVTLSQTEVAGNSATNLGQSAIQLSGGSSVRILNSLVHDNDSGAGSLMRMSGLDNNLAISASTITANVTSSPVIRFTDSAGSAGSVSLRLDRSIIWQPGTLVHNAAIGDDVNSTCINANADSGISADNHVPGFVDAAIGDYRLQPGFLNIDACTNVAQGIYIDLFGTPRPIALGIPATPFDRGAHEFTDVIFADDFNLPKFAQSE